MKTPNYALIESFTLFQGSSDPTILAAGTFVRPIQTRYLPSHVLKDERWKGVVLEKVVFCYTHYGIIPIPQQLVKEV